jgi:type I restriction enzyme R subunit
LLQAVTEGSADEDALSSLARRLALLDKRLNAGQREEVKTLLDVPSAPQRFTTLQELSNALLDSIDPDCIQAQALSMSGRTASALLQTDTSALLDPASALTGAEIESARHQLTERAVIPLATSPELRSFLLEREILIDETSLDTVLNTGFDQDATAHARQLVESFQQFIQAHKEEITALQILFSRPYAQRRLDFEQVRSLAEQLDLHLHQADPLLLTEALCGMPRWTKTWYPTQSG